MAGYCGAELNLVNAEKKVACTSERPQRERAGAITRRDEGGWPFASRVPRCPPPCRKWQWGPRPNHSPPRSPRPFNPNPGSSPLPSPPAPSSPFPSSAFAFARLDRGRRGGIGARAASSNEWSSDQPAPFLPRPAGDENDDDDDYVASPRRLRSTGLSSPMRVSVSHCVSLSSLCPRRRNGMVSLDPSL